MGDQPPTSETTTGANPPAEPARSPSEPAKSPSEPARSPATSSHDPPAPLIAAEFPENEDPFDENDAANSTASVTSSIFEYRTIQGRTYHSERHNSQYFAPNDERQSENVDITHHYMTLLLDGKLHLAPIKPDIHKVIDIGTGNGIWAIDFGDEYPNAEVTGTDLSPMMPSWVPPNVKFEIDDATKPWTWPDNSVDFVHIRFMAGSISDWPSLFREAYRILKPGGWIESGEFDPRFLCDDGSADGRELVGIWNKVFEDGGKAVGSSFTVIDDDVQELGIREAGFGDVQGLTLKAPLGPWAADKKLAEVGRFVHLSLENDMEGYTLFLCTTILGWTKEEHQVFMMGIRKMIRNYRNVHLYFNARYVWGQKPGGTPEAD